jgi:exonuclease SbcC
VRVVEVALENIKSYEERTTVRLQDGVTAILGENGSGKSTIQEAIGFALFDSLPFNNKEFVREGSNSGTVEVTIDLHEGDETQRYRVMRSAGYSRYGVTRYDFSADEWLNQDIDSKSELVQWLCARFDLEDGDELQSLWESCIGVPQTRFLSDFAQRPQSRKNTFDELLNIDAYRDSWETLKSVPDQIEAEQDRVRGELQRLTGEVRALPKKRSESEEVEQEISDLADSISSMSSELETVNEERRELEAVEEQIGELEQEIQETEQAISAKESALETAERELEAAKEAARVCEETRDDHEQYLAAKEQQEELEGRVAELDDLRKQRQEQQGKKQRLEAKEATLEEQAEKYQRAEAELGELGEKKDRYDELEKRISELEENRQTIEQHRDEIDNIDAEARDALSELRQTISTIEEIEREAAETTPADDLRGQLGDVKAERTALEAEEQDLLEKLERLRDAEANAPCPTCGRQMDAEHREATIEERHARLEEVRARQDELQDEIGALQEAVAEAERIEQRVGKLDIYQEKVESLRTDLRTYNERREELKEEITTLNQELGELPGLEKERDSLEEAVSEYHTASVRVADYEDAPVEVEEVRSSIDRVQQQVEELDGEIEEFGDVEERLAEVKSTARAAEDGYTRFEQNKQAAEKLPEREAAVEEIESEIASLESQLEGTEETLEATRDEFDSEELETLEDRREELSGEVNRLSGVKSTKEETLADLQSDIEELEEKLESRQEKVETLRDLTTDHRFASWLRENIKAAGPKMRDVITDRIGKRADTIFRSIRGRKAEQLEWTSDYDIEVVDGDVRKSFATLSGGEKMAAALSVRLAILEQISSLGIAFLDEPTANLDRQKKSNLVDQLNGLDAFEQLTVISHDSSFDAMTDYSITIEKPNQTSEVVSD